MASWLEKFFPTAYADEGEEEDAPAEEPEEEEEEDEDEEDEEEVEDPRVAIKEDCAGHCTKYKAELDKCGQRVAGGKDEDCTQELFDFLHCVDHCVSEKLFTKLK